MRVEKEINQFKLIMLGENYVKRLKTEKFVEFNSEFFEFIERIEKEGDFENNFIHDTYKKLISEYKMLMSE